MDIIYLRDLRIETVIGVDRWEREMKQTLVIDLELGTDIRPAANSDAIADTGPGCSIATHVKPQACARAAWRAV